MNYYIEAVCEGKPMGLPEYDMDAEQWAVYFEESSTPWHPNQERDVLPVYCVNAELASLVKMPKRLAKFTITTIINPVMEEKAR